ncbi:DUF397 domain-containing protein [Nocardiopsis flavescens]|uniref:DUF397 domain-containing protein n=1 Tax=Nocardiopsis flavescens TaxID=758803 RepID=UPI003650299D
MTKWHKSSYSGAQSDCVEVTEGAVTSIRDTRNRELGYLSFPGGEWTALLNAVSSEI